MQWSNFGAADGDEVNCHMLHEQDTFRSSDSLHDDIRGALGSDLCLREVPVLYLGEKDHHLY